MKNVSERGSSILGLLIAGFLITILVTTVVRGHGETHEMIRYQRNKLLADFSAAELAEYFRSLSASRFANYFLTNPSDPTLSPFRLCDQIHSDPLATVPNAPFPGFIGRYYVVQLVNGLTMEVKLSECGKTLLNATLAADDRFLILVGVNWQEHNAAGGIQTATLSILIPGAITVAPLIPQPSATPTPSPIPPSADHLIFVSSSLYRGNLGGLNAAHSICTSLAIAAGRRVDRPWKAILATDTIHPVDYLTLTGPVKNIRGEIIESATDFFTNNTSLMPVRYTEQDTDLNSASNYRVWTGLKVGSNGALIISSNNCNDWASSSDSQLGECGNARSNPSWLREDARDCDIERRLYCISQ